MERHTGYLTLLILLSIALYGCKSYEFYGTLFEKPAYNFTLKNTDGKEVSLSDFKGNIVLIFFGYTHCPDICPSALNKLAKVYENLGEDRKKVKVLFITVDPERDKPEVIKEYLSFFNKDFIGLYGTEEEIRKVAREYMVFFRKAESNSKAGYLVDHTDAIFLIDQKGQLKLIYTHRKQDPDKMLEDIKHLL